MRDKHCWPYLAGITDGEGCFHIAKFKPYGKQWAYRLDIHITTTSKVLAQYLVSNVGGKFYTIEMKNPKWNTAYRWQISGRKNKEEFILGVLPHLIIKKRLAEICLEFIRIPDHTNDPELREKLMLESRVYSRRGRSVETDTPSEPSSKIQSDLQGDLQSALLGTATA